METQTTTQETGRVNTAKALLVEHDLKRNVLILEVPDTVYQADKIFYVSSETKPGTIKSVTEAMAKLKNDEVLKLKVKLNDLNKEVSQLLDNALYFAGYCNELKNDNKKLQDQVDKLNVRIKTMPWYIRLFY